MSKILNTNYLHDDDGDEKKLAKQLKEALSPSKNVVSSLSDAANSAAQYLKDQDTPLSVDTAKELGKNVNTLWENRTNGSSTSAEAFSDIYKQLADSLEAIDKKYSVEYNPVDLQLPESLNTEKLNYLLPTSSELDSLARESLSAKYNNTLSDLNLSKEKNSRSVAQQAEEVAFLAKQKQDEIEKVRKQKAKLALQNAVKKGTARSSIALGEQESIDSDYLSLQQDLDQTTNFSLSQLDGKLDNLQKLYSMAVNELNKTQDADVKAKVNALLEKALETQREIAQYNNKLSENEQKYQASKAEKEFDAQNAELKRVTDIMRLNKDFGTGYVADQVALEKLSAVKNMVDSMEKQQALDLLNSSGMLQFHLGDYFGYLKEYIATK